MKVMAHTAFITNAFHERLVYRSELWARIFGELVRVLARIAIWTSIYAGVSAHNGITLPEMITYILIAATATAFNYKDVLDDVGDAVRSGDVAVYLLKPMHYPAYMLASRIGHEAFNILTVAVPIFIIVWCFFGLQPPASPFHGVAFLLFWTISFLITFTLAMLCGLISFWLLTSDSLEWFYTGILALASGSIIPLWFMPPALANALGYQPFAWIGYYPAAVYLGRLDVQGTLIALAGGIAWVAVLGALVAFLWSRARYRLVVQGG
jgi:ABC-2 type transport system permease protein